MSKDNAIQTENNEKNFKDLNIPNDLWKYFVAYQYKRHRGETLNICWVALFSYISFTIPIYFYEPSIQPLDFLLRCFTILIFSVLVKKFYIQTKNVANLDILILAFVVCACVTWISLFYNLNSDHGYRLSLAGTAVCLISSFILTRFIYAVLICTTVLLSGLILFPRLNGSDIYIYFDTFVIILPTCIFSMYICWSNLQRSKYHFLKQYKSEQEKSELNQHNQNLRSQAYTDPLTQIGNRRLFEIHGEDSLQRSIDNTNVNFALFMLDLDFFKPYNDNYGHVQGDECLIKISKTLDDICSYYNAKVYRYGGEEFIVCYEYGNKYDLINLARTLLMVITDENIEHKFRGDSKEYVTVSIGASNSQDHKFTCISKMVDFADKNLYQAKKEGKDTFVV